MRVAFGDKVMFNHYYSQVLAFASEAHKGQKRKYTDEDYISHPIAVADLVDDYGGDDHMIFAALLHDVLEDTDVNHEELRVFLHKIFMVHVAEDILKLVVDLTDVFTKESFPDMNRKLRKENESQRLAFVSERAKLIKMADIDHNSESIEKHDPKFAKVFLEEKKNLLQKIN
jgi:(p)ppGpp synthase/HD superfamily hydrolase